MLCVNRAKGLMAQNINVSQSKLKTPSISQPLERYSGNCFTSSGQGGLIISRLWFDDFRPSGGAGAAANRHTAPYGPGGATKAASPHSSTTLATTLFLPMLNNKMELQEGRGLA